MQQEEARARLHICALKLEPGPRQRRFGGQVEHHIRALHQACVHQGRMALDSFLADKANTLPIGTALQRLPKQGTRGAVQRPAASAASPSKLLSFCPGNSCSFPGR